MGLSASQSAGDYILQKINTIFGTEKMAIMKYDEKYFLHVGDNSNKDKKSIP